MEEEQHTSISFNGRRLSTEGNYGISFHLISTPCHWRRYRDHSKAFKPVFQYDAGIVMDTFWESGQEGEKTLVQVCWFIPFVGYPPKTKACPWSHYPDIAGCFNPQLFTSLYPSFDHLLSSALTLLFAPLQFLLNPSPSS